MQLTLADRVTIQGMEILLQFTQVQYPQRGFNGRTDMGQFAGITGETAYWTQYSTTDGRRYIELHGSEKYAELVLSINGIDTP